jgi:hypothetical protein
LELRREPKAMEDTDRKLGVVEALVAVRDQCPSGAVRRVAERALDDIKTRREGAVREQAFNVLSAIQGWRSQRATQVHASLTAFLEDADSASKD